MTEPSSSVLQYLRWCKSLMRRLREDFANYKRAQGWWAQGVSISPLALIRTGKYSQLEIGRNSVIGAYTILDLQNDPLDKVPVTSVIKIGQRTSINEFNNIRASGGEIAIGDECLISEYVSIIATNYSTARDMPMRLQNTDETRTRVQIGNDVWIGTHAVILPGAQIGTGCVIGGGAVVTGPIPDYAIAVGVPAKVIRYR
jgi:acetyltransferase-like isoleucine patch superfamily enzyme